MGFAIFLALLENIGGVTF